MTDESRRPNLPSISGPRRSPRSKDAQEYTILTSRSRQIGILDRAPSVPADSTRSADREIPPAAASARLMNDVDLSVLQAAEILTKLKLGPSPPKLDSSPALARRPTNLRARSRPPWDPNAQECDDAEGHGRASPPLHHMPNVPSATITSRGATGSAQQAAAIGGGAKSGAGVSVAGMSGAAVSDASLSAFDMDSAIARAAALADEPARILKRSIQTKEQLEIARKLRSRRAPRKCNIEDVAQALTWMEQGERMKDIQASLNVVEYTLRNWRAEKAELTEQLPADSLKAADIPPPLEQAVDAAFPKGVRAGGGCAIRRVAQVLIWSMKGIPPKRIRQELRKTGVDITVRQISRWWKEHQHLKVHTFEKTVHTTYTLVEYIKAQGL